MREDKYRAKTHSGNWVYGSLVSGNDGIFIIPDGSDIVFREPTFNSLSMGLGVEDRGIIDRYEAAAYGFKEAIDRCIEFSHETIRVIPETVGELIKANIPLYEGDVCKYTSYNYSYIGVIEYNPETFCYILRRSNKTFVRLDVIHDSIEIIGNIHDNKELLTTK